MTGELSPQRLTAWLTEPVPGRGVRIADPSGEDWQYLDYRGLAASARRVAAALIEDGVRAGDIVCVLMPTGFATLAAFFGAWVAGATPCLIAPPAFAAREEYLSTVASILAQARPKLTVTSPELAEATAGALARAGTPDEPWLWREAAHEARPVPPAGLALLQFTSGSTGVSRGVRVSWSHLAANITQIRDWLSWADGDVTASWLPLHHDMGLIGCLLTPVTAQGDLWLMRPAQFIRDPARWLRCLARAQHTAAPPFALDYVTRRARPADLDGLDLSGWRGLILGAEPIDPHVLENFTRLLAPAGFRPEIYRTAYGLAEATLAVTAHTGPGTPRAVRLRPDSVQVGRPVVVEQQRRLAGGDAPTSPGWLGGCGRPTGGVTVAVVDDTGVALPAGHVGEIAVTGPSIAAGYQPDAGGRTPTGGSTRFRDGVLLTGDAGFLHDGELFVLGRLGDSLKLRGRSVFVEDLEAEVARATGLPRSRFAVVTVPDTGRPRVALLVESAPGAWAPAAAEALAAALGPDVGITVLTGRGGLVARTTSGKPRRRRMAALLAGSPLPGATVWHPPPVVAGATAVTEGVPS
jgi:fatty-acyl-CoA synthase